MTFEITVTYIPPVTLTGYAAANTVTASSSLRQGVSPCRVYLLRARIDGNKANLLVK